MIENGSWVCRLECCHNMENVAVSYFEMSCILFDIGLFTFLSFVLIVKLSLLFISELF